MYMFHIVYTHYTCALPLLLFAAVAVACSFSPVSYIHTYLCVSVRIHTYKLIGVRSFGRSVGCSFGSFSICSVDICSCSVRAYIVFIGLCVCASSLRLRWGKPSKYISAKTYGESVCLSVCLCVCVCATTATAAAAALYIQQYMCVCMFLPRYIRTETEL